MEDLEFPSDADPILRTLYLMHWAWVHARSIAHESGNKQLADLADTMEVIPDLLLKGLAGDEEAMTLLIGLLKSYGEKHGWNLVNRLLEPEADIPSLFRKESP